MKANNILRENIRALLKARGQTSRDLAMWMRHGRAWLSKLLLGQRQLKMDDLDRLADFLGVEPFQLLQPGATAKTERRAGHDRRRGQERRRTPAARLEAELSKRLRLRADDPLKSQVAEEIARLLELQDDDARRRAAGNRDLVPPTPGGAGPMGSGHPRKTTR